MEYKVGDKVKHKTRGVIETIIGFCKVKFMGVWVEGVIYEGIDYKTNKPMTFVRTKEDFENNFKVIEE